MSNNMDANQEYLIGNGLLESTPEDIALFDQCMASAVPISALWADSNNDPKFVQWDDDLEKYLKHRAALIDNEGREKMLPFNLYESQNLQWLNGYNYIQKIGDCSSHAGKNSLKASDLVNSHFTGIPAVEVHPSITYCYSRGNGKFLWGSGENLNPYQKWLAELGNFATSDCGKYTGARPKVPTDTQKINALRHQSIIIPLPNTDFDTLWLLCAAGIGVTIGASVYPTSATVNKDGVGVPATWASGGHATAFIGAIVINGVRYLVWENSHGNRYKVGKIGHASGCLFTERDLAKIASAGFRYGTWFGNVGELHK